MATKGFRGGFEFKIGNGAGPEVFTKLEAVTDFSGFGRTNPLIDVTSFDSGSKEYIAGLPDGSEITVNCVREHPDDASSTNQQEVVRGYVKAGTTFNCRLELTNDQTNVKITYDFAVVAISEELSPAQEDKHTISFTLKMTGDVTEAITDA